tara:strand:+ start:151 stop:525 length:375 start_codon:yes stop_codon:yes gene_type:complete
MVDQPLPHRKEHIKQEAVVVMLVQDSQGVKHSQVVVDQEEMELLLELEELLSILSLMLAEVEEESHKIPHLLIEEQQEQEELVVVELVEVVLEQVLQEVLIQVEVEVAHRQAPLVEQVDLEAQE